MPIALTIAGSDPCGGAGIQADLKTFAALEVYGVSVVTALTAQSTVGVRAVFPVPAAFLRAQLAALLEDVEVRVVKIGMLPSVEAVDAVVDLLEDRKLVSVVDPVFRSGMGDALGSSEAAQRLKQRLLPRAHVLTPNLDEVCALGGARPQSIDEMAREGRRLLALGPQAVLVKGGHLEGQPIDVLVEPDRETLCLFGARAAIKTHGTGCTLSSAIAAGLARGLNRVEAVKAAHAYVQAALHAAASGGPIGRGGRPLHHLHRLYRWPGPSVA
ncbi:MAG: bifunctional hydroxymethylpyrimidine kinase/phosphomethylpyrimidine kinase [Deltaproteobacteria bacterium]|nr:bifunctional hydroxymethylpyrimidine kinase/phosphomethylpyrimidine kinase [Deltaproteobacteria bacterium]